MTDVGKQTKPIVKMICPKCKSKETEFRLPRDTQKDSFSKCEICGSVEEFP